VPYNFSFTTIPQAIVFPTVTTVAVSSITSTTAILNANLISKGTANAVIVSFEWGTVSEVYINETTTQPLTVTGPFNVPLTGLAPSTTYYYRAKAVGDGTAYGEEMSFMTSADPPAVNTNVATNVTSGSATLNGNLTIMGTASTVTVSFEWGTTTSYGNTTPTQVMSGTGAFNAPLTGLAPNTLYHFRAKATGDGTVYGSDMTFNTLAILPIVTTNASTSITSSSAILNGTLVNKGSAATVNVSFQWGTAPGIYPNETTVQLLTSTSAFNMPVSGLNPSTTYYYRAKAVGDGTAYGEEMSFTTQGLAIVEFMVDLQGGSRPDSGYVIPLTVKLFTPGSDVLNGTPVYILNLTTTKSGANAIAQCPGIIPANYDITAVSEHTLMNVKRNVTVTSPSVAVSLGTLLEGNADNNNIVDILDLGLFIFAYNTMIGGSGYDAMVDFDRNGIINMLDFGLLSFNYNRMSPVKIP
jgi:phosphodiesterase/alkaline phosphatase D-like protein